MVAAIRQGGATLYVPALAAGLAVLVGVGVALNPVYGLGAAIATIFCLIVVTEPLLGLAVMVVLAYAATLGAGSSLTVAKLAGMVLAGSWLLRATASRGSMRSLVAERPLYSFAIVLFLGWALLSVTWAGAQGEALSSASRYALNALLVPIFFAVVRTERDVVRIFAALLVGAVIAGVSGTFFPPEPGFVGRASGTVGDANELAASLLIGLGVGAGFAFNRQLGSGARALGAVAMLFSLSAIGLSLSRGGLIGLGVMMATAVVLSGRWQRPVTAGAVALVLGVVLYFTVLAPPSSLERVTTASGGTGRVDLWTVGTRMVAAHPIVGVGTGQFPLESVHYLLRPGAILRQDYILTKPKVAHNTYLNILAELGVVGGVLLFGVMLANARALWRASRLFARLGNSRLELISRGLLCAIAGYFVSLLFISENYTKLLWLLLAAGVTLLAVAQDQARGEALTARPA